MAMNQTIKKQWVKALRSGKYKQGFGRLRDGDRFCVLGVLCNIHAQEHPNIARRQKSEYNYLGSSHCLPSKVAEWAGLKDSSFILGKGSSQRSIIHLNDSMKLSFNELAAAIEFSDL